MVHLSAAVQVAEVIHSFVGTASIIIITFIVCASCTHGTKAVHVNGEDVHAANKIQAMRERLGDDKQRQSQEMMKPVQSGEVNPLGGCFPADSDANLPCAVLHADGFH